MRKKRILTVTLASVMSIAAAMMMGCGDNKSSSQVDNNLASSSISSGAEKSEASKNVDNSTEKATEKTSASTSSQKTSADIQNELAQIDEEASVIDARLQNENLTQNEMNQLTAQVYKLWDDKLNSMWSYLSDTLDSSTMKTLKEEENTWIKKKDSQVKEAGKEAAGGSMQPMLENTKAAELTRDRVYELAKYYK